MTLQLFYAGEMIDQVRHAYKTTNTKKSVQLNKWKLRYGKTLFAKCEVKEIVEPEINHYSGKSNNVQSGIIGNASKAGRKLPVRKPEYS